MKGRNSWGFGVTRQVCTDGVLLERMEQPVELSKPAGREEKEYAFLSEVEPWHGPEEHDMIGCCSLDRGSARKVQPTVDSQTKFTLRRCS